MSQTPCQACGKPTDATLCHDCTDASIAALLDMPGLISALADAHVRQTHVYRAAARRREPDQDWRGSQYALRPTALPVDLDASRILNATRWLWHTYRWVATHKGQRDWRRRTNALGDYRAIHRGHQRAERAVDRAPSAIFAGPCEADITEVVTEIRDGTIYVETITGKCTRDLYAWFAWWRTIDDDQAEDDRRIRCDGWNPRGLPDQGCGAEYTVEDRLQWLLDSIEDALVPLAMVEEMTKGPKPLIRMTWPPHPTVRSWKFRGQLPVVGLDRQGRELHRGGTILDLVRGWNDRGDVKRGKIGA